MKTLKGSLILALISVIVVPIVVTSGVLALLSLKIENTAEEIDAAHQLTEAELLAEMVDLPPIENASFSRELDEISEDYDLAMSVIHDGRVIYEKGDTTGNANGLNFNYAPISIEGSTLADENLDIEVYLQSTVLERRIIQYILFSLGSGVLSLILIIIGWIWLLSKSVLSPLKSIYEASEEARKGNLDYPVTYHKKDEIGRFISSFNLMRQEINSSFEKQKQYEAARKELIASISHDLRTPLSSIQGYVEGLRDGVVRSEEQQKKYLDIIHRKTRQLDRLIEDLFDLTKLELEKLPIEKQLLCSDRFLEDMLEYLYTAEQNHQMLVHENELPSVQIEIDPDRMQQVMTNLIDNAFRYGGDRVEIKFRVDGHFLTIGVTDNGVGMSESTIKKIFTPFYRAEKARSHGGTGLGLAIAKHIVDAHGGHLSAVSREGAGSTFTVSLPVKREENEQPEEMQ